MTNSHVSSHVLLSRRDALRTGIGAVGALAVPAPAAAQSPQQSNTGRIGGLLNQLGQQAQWRSPELRLVRRVSLGLNAAEVERVRALGYDGYLEEQLNPERIDDRVCDERVRNPILQQLLSRTARDFRTFHQSGSSYYDSYLPTEVLNGERAVFSRRQLHERLFEFFCDHLHVPIFQSEVGAPLHYERVIRPHVLGSFGAMTRAGMRSPAMFHYLDQVWSTRFGVNENYARELLELHTVGVDGGYTQADVAGLARILTGWSVDANGEFVYRADNHDFTAKSAFGMSFPARAQAMSGTTGMDEGIAFGEMLIRHPRTKRYLATKLLRFFVRPDPSEQQINAVVNAYGEEGDIRAMMRVVLARENLVKAPAKLKRPYHYAISVVRGTEATIRPVVDIRRTFVTLSQAWIALRQPYMRWPTPDGFTDRPEFWAGLIVDRWNTVQSILLTDIDAPGRVVVDLDRFRGDGTANGVVAEISRRLFGGEMSTQLDAELRQQLRAGVTNARLRTALQLAVSAPEFHFF